MVVPEDFTLNGTFSLSTITELEKRRRTDNLTGIRRQLHDYAKSVVVLLQLEVNNPEVAEQITQAVSSALTLLNQIKTFVPILSTIDINKYHCLVRAFNAWQDKDPVVSAKTDQYGYPLLSESTEKKNKGKEGTRHDKIRYETLVHNTYMYT